MIQHHIHHQVYLLASQGKFIVSDKGNVKVVLKKGDGAEITKVNTITLEALSDCELLLIDTP